MLFAALIQNVERLEIGLLGKHIYPLRLYIVLKNVKSHLASHEDVLSEISKGLNYVRCSKSYSFSHYFDNYNISHCSQLYLFQRMEGLLK